MLLPYSILGAPLRSASIQFPDPHFKTKHHKRRVVQPELARPYARVRLRVSYVFDLGALPYCLLLTTPLTKARSLNAYYSLLHSLRRAPSPLTTHYSTH